MTVQESNLDANQEEAPEERSEKLRLLHMVGAAKPGGAETFALRLLTSLHRNHPEVELVVAVRQHGWLAGQLKAAGVNTREYSFGGALDIQTAKQVRALARDFQPHVITSWMNRATRFVPRGPWTTMGRLGGYYDLKYYRGKVTWLAANTRDICDYCITNGWDAEKVLYLPNFVPEPEEGFRQKRADVRRKLGFGPGDVVLLQAGRLHPNKAVDVSLKALAGLPENFKLMLAGEGPQREELEEYAKTLDVADRVIWLGWVSDLSGVAAAADIWLAPSRLEPLGNIVLDAWMHSVPLVAAKSTGPLHLITPGKDGLLFEIDDVEGLKKAVLDISGDKTLAEHLADEGLATGRAKFGEEQVVAQYLSTYKKLILEREQKPHG